MGAPQFLHLPRNNSQVTSGRLRYQGIEYLQWGQCEGGEIMLCPEGILWMQTLRKLPTIVPRTKATTDQKWNGTPAQFLESKTASTIEVLFKGAAHRLERRGAV